MKLTQGTGQWVVDQINEIHTPSEYAFQLAKTGPLLSIPGQEYLGLPEASFKSQ